MKHVFFTDRDLGRQFPAILKSNGLAVERHENHFSPDTPDEVWLEEVGRRRWVALTHDRRIRYKPNERDAVVRHRVALLVIVGTAPYPQLARSFVAALPSINRFLDCHEPPFIAKVYRQSHVVSSQREEKPGHVELWYPRS